jgi:hypothetical protein
MTKETLDKANEITDKIAQCYGRMEILAAFEFRMNEKSDLLLGVYGTTGMIDIPEPLQGTVLGMIQNFYISRKGDLEDELSQL